MISTMRIFYPLNLLHLISVTSIILISGCDTNLNYSQYLDLPKNLYQSVSASGPAPKETGIITFETYAVVRAKKGERLFNVADRINVSSKKLAVHNGVSENYQLGQGEVLAIPLNILPNHNDGSINIAKVASKAIDRVKTEQESEVEEKIEQTDQSEKNETIGTNVSKNVTSTSEMNLKTYIKPIDGEISSPFSYDVNGNQGINIQAPQGLSLIHI